MDAADRTEAATKQMASAERMGLGEQQVAASAAPATREAACSRAEGQFSSSLGDALNRGSGIPKDLADAAATEHDARVTGHKALSDRYADFADQQKDLAQQQSDLITKAHDAIRSIIDLRHQARMAALNARG
jgi:phage-related minor tail protein